MGVVLILAREGAGVEVGTLEKEVGERAAATLRFSANANLTTTPACLATNAGVSTKSPDILLQASGPLAAGAGVNSRRVLRDPLHPSDGKGNQIADRRAQSDLRLSNAGEGSEAKTLSRRVSVAGRRALQRLLNF
ncbi:hypothetical protein ERJ75_001338800 [Trypanosoma vivax]|nr:hypothetical protein ERJ75_001338200 [Trypanosoma vivax]KAH8608305.1 hypothetical protein ERJ75_001338800 [Trypanosoma vivax]